MLLKHETVLYKLNLYYEPLALAEISQFRNSLQLKYRITRLLSPIFLCGTLLFASLVHVQDLLDSNDS